MRFRSLVLLSGGADSVALLHWARRRTLGGRVYAISFDYGQPNRDAELTAAQAVAERLLVPWWRYALADAVRGFYGLQVPQPGQSIGGVSRANLPARNAIFLSIAAAHATLEDRAGFPDCRPEFIDAAGRALAAACEGAF